MTGDPWPTIPLGALCDSERGITYGIVKVGDFIPGGIPVIRGGDIRGGRIVCDDSKRVTEHVSNQFRRTILKGGEIVLNLIADPGHSAIVPLELAGHNVSRDVAVIPLNGSADVRFVDFFLKSRIAVDWLTARLQGSVTQKINIGTLRELPVPSPPIADQRSIAAVLGALDDKIELNRRMNATLEAMAQALYRSWFVDFDPVCAKLDGRSPANLDPVTAALFPTSFRDSPLGPIPYGWTDGTVNDAFSLTMGQSPPGDTYNEEGHGLPFYQGRTDFGFRFPTRRVYCTGPTRYANASDTLVSVRAPVGDINMAKEQCCIGRGIAAVRHKTGASSFTYYAMANLEPDFAKFEAEGTVFGSINRQNFENLRFLIPPQEVVAAYEQQAKPIDKQIFTLEHQSLTLATLRDTLLPKLLSGELSVSTAAETIP